MQIDVAMRAPASSKVAFEAALHRLRCSHSVRSGLRWHLLLEKSLQFPRLEHLRHDVTTANKFPSNVQLGDCRPIRVIPDPLPQFFGFVDVVRFEGYAEMAEYSDHSRRESASRSGLRAFHKQNDFVGVHLAADEICNTHDLSLHLIGESRLPFTIQPQSIK